MIRRLSFGVAGAVLAVTAAAAAESVLLRFQPEAGGEWRLEINLSQDLEMTMGPAGGIDATNRQRMVVSQSVESVDDAGLVTLTQTVERIVIEAAAGGEAVMNVDTATAAELPEEVAVFGSLIGVPLTLVMTPQGEVADMQGWEEIFSSLEGGNAMLLEQLMGEDSLRQQMQQYTVVFPGEAVEVGDSWQHEMSLSNPAFGSLDFTTEYTLTSVEPCGDRQCVVLAASFVGALDFDSPILGALAAAGETNADVEPGKITGGGTLTVDRDSGVTVASLLDFELSLSMSLGVPEGEGFALGMNLHQVVETALTDAAAGVAAPGAQIEPEN